MADITQRLGFDASQALEQINLLNQALQALNTMLGSTGAAIGQWNSVGTAAVNQFNSMRNAADAARKAIEALSNAQSKAATDAARVNAAPSRVNVPTPPPDMTAYLQQVEKLGASLGAIPQKASDASRRGYASAQASLAQFAQANQMSLQQVSTAWNNNGQVVTGNANKAANLAQQVKNAHQQMAQSAQQSTAGLGLSWQQLAQVIQGTAIHTLVRGFISLLREGVVEAVDFGKRVAENITIIGTPFKATQQDITNLGNTIISMSNKYGQAASNIAEGYYQELSARVGSATESLYVLDQALKLSVATNSSLADSDKLLTATLNSYGLAAGEAARVSDILFTSVTTGRYHMNELANIVGRVFPIANELGVSLHEVMAAVNTMTVAGVKADTAFTQMRGIFTQLLKPTKELTDLMQNKWGVSNAQEALTLFGGFIPLLQALSKEAGGASDEMADFFKNVRALTGVMQTTNGHIERLRANFEALKNAPPGITQWAAQLVLDTPAKKAEIAWINLKNTFMQMAQSALPLLATLGGLLNDLVKSVESLAAGLAMLAGGAVIVWFYNFIKALQAAKVAAVETQIAVGKLPIIMAFLVGFEIGEQLKKAFTVDWDTIEKDQETARQKMLEKENWYASVTAEVARRRTADELTEAQRVTSALVLLQQQNGTLYAGLTKQYADVTQITLNNILNIYKKIVSELEKDEAAHEAVMEGYQNKLVDNMKNASERMFEIEAAQGTKREQEQAKINAAKRVLSEAELKFASARTQKEIEDAIKLLDAAMQRTNESINAAVQNRGYTQDFPSLKRMLAEEYNLRAQYTKKQLELETASQEKRAEVVAQAKKDEEATAEDIKAIMEGLTVKKKGGLLKSPEEEGKDLAASEEAIQRLRDRLLSSGKNVDINQLLGLVNLQEKLNVLERELRPIQLKIQLNKDLILAQLLDIQEKLPESLSLTLSQKNILASPQGLMQGVQNLNKESEGYRKNIEAAGSNMRDIASSAADAADNMEKMKNVLPATPITGWGQVAPIEEITKRIDATKQYKQVVEGLQASLRLDPSTPAGWNAFMASMGKWLTLRKQIGEHPELYTSREVGFAQKIDEYTSSIITKRQELDKAHPYLQEELDKLRTNDDIQKQILEFIKQQSEELKKTPEGVRALNNALDLTNKDAGAAAAAANTLDSNLSASIGTAQSLAAAMYEVAAAASAAAQASAQASQYAATGGLIRHLAGGGTGGRGLDTIPAMLSPGEFVVNAGASRKFFSQLVAMNSGGNPVFRTGGGQSNITVGDINISNASQPQATAREVISLIKRELRRETSSW